MWDPARPTEGAYSAFMTFEDGAFASLVYSGYAHFDSDEFCNWTAEMGCPRIEAAMVRPEKRCREPIVSANPR
jgi:phthalate 4,5-cis-dihydrodiol dehydrogenase